MLRAWPGWTGWGILRIVKLRPGERVDGHRKSGQTDSRQDVNRKGTEREAVRKVRPVGGSVRDLRPGQELR